MRETGNGWMLIEIMNIINLYTIKLLSSTDNIIV